LGQVLLAFLESLLAQKLQERYVQKYVFNKRAYQIAQSFNLTLAPQFAAYGECLNSNVRVNNSYAINWSGYSGVYATLTPAVITNTTAVTPAILVSIALFFENLIFDAFSYIIGCDWK
jgi:hypothetical protein